MPRKKKSGVKDREKAMKELRRVEAQVQSEEALEADEARLRRQMGARACSSSHRDLERFRRIKARAQSRTAFEADNTRLVRALAKHDRELDGRVTAWDPTLCFPFS